jgi:Mg2+/Co2+ transporter CorC
MNEMEKQYDEMNFEDLFNQVVGELNEEKDAEEAKALKDLTIFKDK